MSKQAESLCTSNPTAMSNSRREFLKSAALGGFALGASVAGESVAAAAAETPPDGWPMSQQWFPSRWGATDQAGASNLMTPAKVLEATALIKTGKVYGLGRVYEAGMPFFGTRSWNLKIPGPPFFGPVGRNKIIGNEEYLCAEIGQVGTQFDGLAHIGVETKGSSELGGVPMADRQGRVGDRSRQLGRRGSAARRSFAIFPMSSVVPDDERCVPVRESEFGRACQRRRVSGGVFLQPAADQRRHRLAGKSDSNRLDEVVRSRHCSRANSGRSAAILKSLRSRYSSADHLVRGASLFEAGAR